MDKKLSKNFNLSEFTTSAGLTIKCSDQQEFCLQTLCFEILQPIRDQFGSVKITSGLRSEESYKKLIAQGYPASKTSDHFAWCTINPKGTGAADFYCPQKNTKEVFHWVIKNLYDKCRQIIYYPDMNVIHVANNFNLIFKAKDDISNERRVMIKSAGETFKPYPVGLAK